MKKIQAIISLAIVLCLLLPLSLHLTAATTLYVDNQVIEKTFFQKIIFFFSSVLNKISGITGHAIINVGPTETFTTIQSAINNASDGDTINVAAGTYTEINIIINKSLTIVGDPGDDSPGPGTNAPVIDGGSNPGDAFKLANGVSGVTISGFEIKGFTSSDTGIGNGVSAWVGSTSDIDIQDNYFHNLGWNGVMVGNDYSTNPTKWGDHTGWTIKNNLLETFEYYGFELTNTNDSTIENNIIHSDLTSNPSTCIMVDAT